MTVQPFLLSPTEFARSIGVSQQAVSKAIKIGRIPAYDETGARAAPGYKGRKLVKPDEARSAFRLSRARIDDSKLAELAAEIDRDLAADIGERAPPAPTPQGDALPPTLVSAKTEKEALQADLLRLRLERERGELVPRQAQLDAMETAGRKVLRALEALPASAEELNALCHSGGLPALTAWLRAKAHDLAGFAADLISAAADEDADPNSGANPEPVS